nr:AraC family transcriptional regulator [uncultured Lachnoclostridium sp.]
MCEYIGNHYDTALITEDIARHFLISKTQLYYIFKEVTGITVSEYITEYRITKAKDFLINTDLSVEMISQAVGYMNISSFSRVFKLKAGCSPLQYRKKHAPSLD